MDTVYVVCLVSGMELEPPAAFYLTEEDAQEAADVLLDVNGESGWVFEVKLGKPPVVTWYARSLKKSSQLDGHTYTWFEVDFGTHKAESVVGIGSEDEYVMSVGSGSTEEEAIADSNRRLDEYFKENE